MEPKWNFKKDKCNIKGLYITLTDWKCDRNCILMAKVIEIFKVLHHFQRYLRW